MEVGDYVYGMDYRPRPIALRLERWFRSAASSIERRIASLFNASRLLNHLNYLNYLDDKPLAGTQAMSTWKPLWEADPESFGALRRVIMAGYYCEMGQIHAKVGEAVWGNPDGSGRRWIWEGGSDVINPLGFQEMPDFPIARENNQYVVGRPVET